MSAAIPAQNTVTTDAHNADVYPIFYIRNPSSNTGNTRLTHIRNDTTGDVLYFALDIMPGEVLKLDLRENQKTMISNYRGSILDFVIQGSSYGEWHLAPGSNTLSLFTTGPSLEVTIQWKERYWSNDNTMFA